MHLQWTWAIGAAAWMVAAAAAAEPVPTGTVPPGTLFRDCPACPDMVTVPAGRFVMGAATGEPGARPDERPQRPVRIDRPFAIGRFEITHRQWQACLDAGGCAGHQPRDHGWGRGDRPVMNVNLADIDAYLAWLRHVTGKSYRLPSEAEWEYAARAGSTTAFFWGDAVGRDRAVCHKCRDGAGKVAQGTLPVGRFPPNRFGLHDMHGNVWEWTADCHHADYRGAPDDGRPWREAGGGDCTQRVQRGGSWYYIAANSRSARRSYNKIGARWYDVGFRVVRDLP